MDVSTIVALAFLGGVITGGLSAGLGVWLGKRSAKRRNQK